jgi:hypothetical protein
VKLLIAFCVGIAATLAWQSYGDAARRMIASSYPQLGWLASLSAIAQTAPATIAPPVTSSDPEDLETISLSLGAMRQRVDDLAASQDQITRDITTKLQVAKQEILDKISSSPPQVAVAPPRNAAPPRPQVPPVR